VLAQSLQADAAPLTFQVVCQHLQAAGQARVVNIQQLAQFSVLQWPTRDEQEALYGGRDVLDGKPYFLHLYIAVHRLCCQVFLHAEAIIP